VHTVTSRPTGCAKQEDDEQQLLVIFLRAWIEAAKQGAFDLP
jgi:hypothetical protein